MSGIQSSSTELVEVRHTQASTSSAFIGGFWTNIFVECSWRSNGDRFDPEHRTRMSSQSHEPLQHPKRQSSPPAEVVRAMLDALTDHPHRAWIERALLDICEMADRDVDRLDWKILSQSIRDMTRAMEMFEPYRYVRKVAIFGSARTPEDAPEFQLARSLAAKLADAGFMALTGAGGGIMEAANRGAGATRSFGLNITLPFEQTANPYIDGDSKAIEFKYFFTRKLFFLKESDAIVLFPGGFGTMDEAFESIVLLQTGKFGPAPFVLVQPPGNRYWNEWEDYVRGQLLAQGLISSDDLKLFSIVEDADVACAVVRDFYSVYHSSRFVGDRLVLRLRSALEGDAIAQLNAEFGDLLASGSLEPSAALPEEAGDETERLPRLVLHFDRRSYGRLHAMIRAINRLGACESLEVCAKRG